MYLANAACIIASIVVTNTLKIQSCSVCLLIGRNILLPEIAATAKVSQCCKETMEKAVRTDLLLLLGSFARLHLQCLSDAHHIFETSEMRAVELQEPFQKTMRGGIGIL